MGFLILKVCGAASSLECSHLSPAPSQPPAPGSRPAASFYTVLRLAPGGLRSGRPPLQPRVQLEERGFQRGDFSLWLRPAQRTDAGEYRAAVSFRDSAHTCRVRLRVGQASSRWGRGEGRRAGGGRPVPDAVRRQEGLGPGCASKDAPEALPASPQKGSGRGWGTRLLSGRCPQKSTCVGGGPCGEIVSPLDLPFPYPPWECLGGGGEAPLGGGREGAGLE